MQTSDVRPETTAPPPTDQSNETVKPLQATSAKKLSKNQKKAASASAKDKHETSPEESPEQRQTAPGLAQPDTTPGRMENGPKSKRTLQMSDTGPTNTQNQPKSSAGTPAPAVEEIGSVNQTPQTVPKQTPQFDQPKQLEGNCLLYTSPSPRD